MEKLKVVITGFGNRSDISTEVLKVSIYKPPPRIPRHKQWLRRCWPPADFPTLSFEYDYPDEMVSLLLSKKGVVNE